MSSSPQTRRFSVKVLANILFWSVCSAVLLHRFVFALYIIQGSSMAPTLADGDTALVNMAVRGMARFDRGEIVLVRDGFRDYATKRIVGLPGERVDIRSNRVYINGSPLRETYLRKTTITLSACPTFKLKADEYFVLGDNRMDSYDSRFYGPVQKSAIVGSYSRTFWACR